MNGLSMADFASQALALEAADSLVAQNKEEYDHPGSRRDHENPLLVGFWYVKSGGRTKKISMGLKERIGETSDDQKSIQQHLALEGPAEGTEEVVVKIENPSWEPFFIALKAARTFVIAMKTQCGKSQSLSAQFQVAGRTNETMKEHHTELAKMVACFTAFIANFELKVAELGLHTPGTENTELDQAIQEMKAMSELGVVHTDGHKDILKRYKNIIDGKVTLDPTLAVRSLPPINPEP